MGTHIFSVQGRVAEQGIIFRIPTPGQGSFLDFPAAPPRMFVGQVPRPPPPRELPNH